MPPDGHDTLRVGVLGQGVEPDLRAAGFAERFELVAITDVEALLGSGLDVVIITAATAERAAEIAATLRDRPGAPPTVLLIGPPEVEHPHGKLLRAIADAKDQWERAFDAIVDPVAILDLSGNVMRANLRVAEVLGRSIGSLIGNRYADLLGPAIGPGEPVALTLTDGEPRTQEARYTNLPGLHQVTASPYRNRSGEAQGVVVILKDVTEFREQQERLLRAARLADVGLLAGGVAHEINTPLASIALRAESLLKAAQKPELQGIDAFAPFPRYLKTIDEEIFRCKRIIGALLEFSRVRKLEARAIDLNALAERALDLVGHQLKLKQVTLTLDLESRLPLIHGDDAQLRQALIALLMNAIDATAPGGSIRVSTRRDGEDEVTLSVADNGAGIPAEDLDKIFNPFFTTKPVGQGTGLGLAMCHGIVASHGGDLRVESKVGSGTRMSLVFPITSGEIPSS